MISNRVNIGPSPFVSTGSSGTSTNPRLSRFAVRTWGDEYGRPSFLVVLVLNVRLDVQKHVIKYYQFIQCNIAFYNKNNYYSY